MTKKEIEQGTAKPDALPVIPGEIPQPLRERQQWIVWKYQRRKTSKGEWKWTKLPVDPGTGRNASSTNPATWGTFDEAIAFYGGHRGEMDGVGYVFTPEDPFCGVDLDDCRDRETGVVKEWAVGILTQFGSYSEVSPSGTGVKLFVLGKLPAGPNRRGPVEMYDHGRFFAVTGHALPQTVRTVERRQSELESLQLRLRHKPAKAGNSRQVQGDATEQAAGNLSDLDLVERAKNAQNGDKFSRLWSGDIAGYASPSEADLALCDLLAFWTGPDPGRIDTLFRQSGLFRDKWQERRGDRTYGAQTIQKALAGRTEFYSANGHAGMTGKGNQGEIHLTDVGNAKRLIRRHGTDMRYCHPWGKWLVWDDRRWLPDATAAVTYRAKETIAALFRWAEKRIEEIRKHLERKANDENEE